MKSIWSKEYNLEDIKKMNMNMSLHLAMEWTEITPTSLSAKMPIDHRTTQPMGWLHGGASCVLAETIGSVASNLVLDSSKHFAVGLSITANHLRSAQSGFFTGTAKAVHLGRTTHVWDIEICDDNGKSLCVSRLTTSILDKK